jgi:hypothetical protein
MVLGDDHSGVCYSAATRGSIRIFSAAAHLHVLRAQAHLPHEGVVEARGDRRLEALTDGMITADRLRALTMERLSTVYGSLV